MNKRETTRKVFVKNVQIGGQNKIVIQSMTKTKTHDIEATLAQIIELTKSGCEIIRVAVLGDNDVAALKELVKRSPIPVVADIHFNAENALQAIESGVAKIRINPGNINDPKKIKLIAQKCKEKKIPIRIGINSGSLPKHIFDKYGFSSDGFVASALENIKLLEDENFFDIIVSVKTTDVQLTYETYTKLAKLINYPLHLGLTEAGSMVRGSVKSTIAMSKIIDEGIGDTIRISLSDDPLQEINVAKELLCHYDLTNPRPNLISCPTCGRIQYDMLKIVREIEPWLNTLKGKVKVAIMGCAVNGFGEAQGAEITVVGIVKKGIIYVHNKPVATVDENEIVPKLKQIVTEYLANQKI